ncbi:hypothetical protein ABPG72_001140 [Tetrahymena utriculariae]
MKKLIILVLSICLAKGFTECSAGCKQCSKLQYEDQYQCNQCKEGYDLDKIHNICIYQQCSANLYFQQEIPQQNKDGSCLSICKPLNFGDSQSNSCQEMPLCSSLFSTSQNFQIPGIPTDFFIFQQIYYVAFNQGYLSVYDRKKIYLIKNLRYLSNDLKIINVDGVIIVLGSSQSIQVWDVINESRTQIKQQSFIQINMQTQATLYKNQYIIIYNTNQSILEFQVIYNINNQKEFVSPSIQINQDNQFVTIINDYLFVANSFCLIVYQISLQIQNNLLNSSSILTCFYQENLQSVLQSPQKDLYFSIYSNTIQSINLKNSTCHTIFQKAQIQKVKIINQGNLSNDFHLVILLNYQFILYKWIENSFNSINLENQDSNQILDFDIGNFSGNNNQLIVISNQTINLYNLNLDKYERVSQNIQLHFISQSIKKIPTLQNSSTLESQNLFEIAFFSPTQIQIIYGSDFQKNSLKTKIIENFNLPFLTTISKVNSLVKVYSPPVLISCLQNGDFLFYDASISTNIQLISRKNFNNLNCLHLDRFFDNNIVALTNQQLLLIDPSQQIVQNEVKYSTDIIQMTLNYDKVAIQYNDCIQILSNQLISLFNKCSSEFSSNNLNIILNYDLKIVTQKHQEISIYQIDLADQSANLIQSIKSINKIIYFDTVKIFNNDLEQIENKFTVDEILFYDKLNNFNIYNIYLNQTYVIPNLAIYEIIEAKRVINDQDIYFIYGYLDIKKDNTNLICISKSNNFTQYIQISDISQGIINPIKIISQSGQTFYHIKLIYNLNTFSLTKELQTDISRNITFLSGVDYLVDNVQNLAQSISLNQNFNTQNLLSYFGTQGGLILVAQLNQSRYQQISSKDMLSQTRISDQILEIIQSPYIGYFFVRTFFKITSFNMFTNEFVEIIQPINPDDLPFSQFSLVEDLFSIVCWNQKQLLLVNYSQLPPQKYYFQTNNKINGWLYNSKSKQFYIYGIGFVVLDSQLKLQNQNFDEQLSKLESIQCKLTQLLIICSLSSSQFILINKKSENDLKMSIVQVNGFQNQFQIYIDEQFQNIFLLGSQIQVYSYNGVLITVFSFNLQSEQFDYCSFQSNLVLVKSQYCIRFIQRDTLITNQKFIQGPSGFQIQKCIYIEYLDQVILYSTSSIFAQIYIYDIKSLQNIGKISWQYGNQVGQVLQMYFDYSSTSVAYLDSEGNFIIYQLFLENSYLNSFKITEVIDRSEQLVGFSYENITNNVLIYSTNSVYQINYSIIGNQYEEQIKEPANLFTSISIDQQNQEFLILNKDNTILRYSQYNICFELLLQGQQVLDIRYNSQFDVLIVALTDRILFYQQYQYSKDNNQIFKILNIQQIQFHKFITSNVYLSLDKKIIHVNIQTGQIVQIIQLQPQVLVTQLQTNSNQDLIFIGLSSSQVLQYDLKDLSIQYYSISAFNTLNTSVVITIYDEQYKSVYAYFGTNGGVLIKVDINQKKKISEINLIDLVKENQSLQLVDFILDQTFSRYIFFFDGQKKAYVWNFSKNQQEQYLILTNNQGNKLKLIENKYIITSCRFQLNIYTLQQYITLLTVIKANFSFDQITDYQVINNNIIVIFYFLTYEVYLITEKSNILISQQTFNLSRYLGFTYDQSNDLLKIYGLHQKGLFEHNYSLQLYYKNNQKISQCSLILSNKDIFKLKQQISNVTPKQSIQYGNYGIYTQNQPDWTNLIFLQASNDQFQTIISQISSNQLISSEFIFSPQIGSQNDIKIYNETFYFFQQLSLKMFNYNFIFDRSDQQILVRLNQNLKKLVWQNITIKSQQISNVNILLQNIQSVTLQSIKLSLLNLCNSTNSQNQNTSLFTFANISQVYIYDLDILSNQLSQNIGIVLFNFTNINSIIIDGMNIKNNHNLSTFFQFTQIANITIQNMNFQDNIDIQQIQTQKRYLIQRDFLENTSIFNFFGCQRIFIKSSNFSQNSQNSFVKLNNITFETNQGGFTLSQSEQITIQNCQFNNNKAQNGGAISFLGIQQKIYFISSLFQKNNAISSGGAFFFVDIGNCEIFFDSQTKVVQNKALIGGGLRIIINTTNFLKIPEKFPFYQNLYQNQAEIYGNDATTYPQQLVIQNSNTNQQQNFYQFIFYENQSNIPSIYQNEYTRYVEIKEFQSGGSLNLRIFIVDNYYRYISFSLYKLLNNLYPIEVEKELKNIQISITNLNIETTQLIGERIIDYNKYKDSSQAFELTGLQVLGTAQAVQFLSISSSIYNFPNQQQPIFLSIQFRKCQLGEIIQQITKSIIICKYCSQSTYSLIDPETLQDQNLKYGIKNQCNNCPSSALQCYGQFIMLKNGYWRSNNLTDEIIPCDSQIGSCQAENKNSINYCTAGYLGPLCQQCDTTGAVWKGTRYQESIIQGICKECASFYLQMIYLLIKLSVVILYFYFNMCVFLQQFKFSQTCYYLRALKIIPFNQNTITDNSGFQIKIIITYYQISSILFPKLSLISLHFNSLSNILGQSSNQIALGIDCLINAEYIDRLGLVIVQAIIQILIPQSLSCTQIGSQQYNPYDLRIDLIKVKQKKTKKNLDLKNSKDKFYMKECKKSSFSHNNKSFSRFSSRNTLFKNFNQTLKTSNIVGSPIIFPQTNLLKKSKPNIHQALSKQQQLSSSKLTSHY